MNSIYFFYKVFTSQELTLKFNNLDINSLITLKNLLIFKPKDKDVDNNLNSISNDLRYIFEFLTNTKATKSTLDKFVVFSKISLKKSLDLLLCLSYLIFSKFNLNLENLKYDLSFPVIQVKKKDNIRLVNKSRSFFDIKFNTGLNFAFLSNREYDSFLAIDFYIRFIFKNFYKKKTSFLFYRQLIFLSIIGKKYFLFLKKTNV